MLSVFLKNLERDTSEIQRPYKGQKQQTQFDRETGKCSRPPNNISFIYNADKKAMIRNRYNQIPHPALNTKRERDTYNLEGTKIKTEHVKSQGDSSFPTDGHNAILNKLISLSKTNRKRTNIDN